MIKLIDLLKKNEYDFLKNNKHLGDNIILIGLGGSYAYGTAIDGESDIDIRGISLNTKNEIILGNGFEQVEDKKTDTVIYSFNKIIKLLSGCNPNVIELLGLNKSFPICRTISYYIEAYTLINRSFEFHFMKTV